MSGRVKIGADSAQQVVAGPNEAGPQRPGTQCLVKAVARAQPVQLGTTPELGSAEIAGG
jgi:hypothetical protein